MSRVSLARIVAIVAFVLVMAPATSVLAKGSPVEPSGVPPEAFPPAQACGCHSALADEWAISMHSQALSDPIFNVKAEEADAATDGKIGDFCRKCHGPAATMTGEIAADSVAGAGTSQGIGCMFCHQVTGLAEGEPGNTSHLVEPNGTRHGQIKDPQAPHPAVYSEIHEKAEFCGGCHNVNHPVNGMHLESTYSEWLESPYAKQGVACQDCHMTQQAGQRGPSSGEAAMGAPTRDNIYHMTFVGGQVALGDPEQATAQLKSAAELKVEAPKIIAPSESGEVKVTITNVGAGHYLPTGLTEVRQMWLEVTAENADGSSTKVGERRFGTILQDEKGNAPVELWEAASVKSDDRIPPGESVTATYTVTMPTGAEKSTLKAALYYKSVPDDLATEAGVENPTTRMAGASQAVFASQEAMVADTESEQSPGPTTPGPLTIVLLAVGTGVVAALAYLWIRSRNSA